MNALSHDALRLSNLAPPIILDVEISAFPQALRERALSDRLPRNAWPVSRGSEPEAWPVSQGSAPGSPRAHGAEGHRLVRKRSVVTKLTQRNPWLVAELSELDPIKPKHKGGTSHSPQRSLLHRVAHRCV